MSPRATATVLWLALSGLPGTAGPQEPPRRQAVESAQPDSRLTSDLDRIFDVPVLSRALVAARVDRLSDGRTVYARNTDALVMPASNMKILTFAVAAATLGWDYRFETRLESTGVVESGVLRGDLIVIGTGDPSIGSPDGGHSSLFLQWADALHEAGIQQIEGRLIGDDDAFADQALGAGWAWDYLSAGYAAPVGALNYNENAVTLRIAAGPAVGTSATAVLSPPGHGMTLVADILTGPATSPVSIELTRPPGQARLVARGSVPLSHDPVTRTAAVDNPTRFFVEALGLALASRGIRVSGGVWDIDDVDRRPEASRRLITTHRSLPLSTLAAYAMKVSQNQYGEAMLRTLGRTVKEPGTVEAGRQVVYDTLEAWGVPHDAVVMYDGSGLSRYNYVTTSVLVSVLTAIWQEPRLRGPFVAELPVAGVDGSLEFRMRNSVLANNVRAKTGTISNVRALSGFVRTEAGDTLVFSMVANHYTAPNTAIDEVMEQALGRLVRTGSSTAP